MERLYRGVGPCDARMGSKCPYCTGDDEKGFHQVSQFFSYRRCDVQKTKDRLVKVIASRGGSANFEPDSKQ